MEIIRLGEKGEIGTIKTKNRLIMTAMGVGIGEFAGYATDDVIQYYVERAKGGAGLIITEITRVNETHGIGEHNQLSLAKDETIPSFTKLADAVHVYDSKIFVQLHHPGREAHLTLNKQVSELVSSSPFPSIVAPEPTRELKTEEVEGLVKDFASAAVRAQKAGIDGVEIHAGHGYLVHQFMSANDNYRTDKYGGNLENRQRFLVEIISEIRQKCGKDYPISVRLSSSEFIEGFGMTRGITLKESIANAIACEKAGANLINVSSGTHFTGNTIVEPTTYEQGWKMNLAAEIKKNVSVPVAATAVIRDPEFAEQVLEEELVDFIAMGRSWLADPEWGVKALTGRSADIRKCMGCMYCFETAGKGLVSGEGHAYCAINPCLGREHELKDSIKDGSGRKVAVVGAGPGGMEAAMILAQREFEVILFEKSDHLGGQLYLASLPPHRRKMNHFTKYCEKQLKDLNVDIRLNTEATEEIIRGLNPYAVIIATGSTAILPGSIPGIHGENVYTPEDVLTGKIKLTDKKIVVAGAGMTGMETAEFLQEAGNDVTEIDMAHSFGFGGFPLLVMDATASLAKSGVRAMPGHKLVEIRADRILVEDAAGIQLELMCDAVIMSLGVRSVNHLKEELQDQKNVIVIGEALKAGTRVAQAVHPAFEAASNL